MKSRDQQKPEPQAFKRSIFSCAVGWFFLFMLLKLGMVDSVPTDCNKLIQSFASQSDVPCLEIIADTQLTKSDSGLQFVWLQSSSDSEELNPTAGLE